jgi:hypothetical protein
MRKNWLTGCGKLKAEFFRQPQAANSASSKPGTKNKRLPRTTAAAILDKNEVTATLLKSSGLAPDYLSLLVLRYLQLLLPGLHDATGLPSAMATGTAADT